MQIAKILKEDKVPTAKAYYAEKKGKALPENPYNWKDSTIVGILERMDYCGHTVNFKSYSKSHKLKKRIPTTKEQQAIFYNTHEAIVEDTVFERIQELRANKRRPTKADRRGLFSGLVYCADCGSKLHFATCKSFNGSQDHYRCAKYKSNTGSCTAHFIREEVLKQIVWSRIFDVTALFFDDIMAFHEMMYQQRSAETAKRIRKMRSLSARKNGTALVIGAIPPYLKLLPSNRKHFRLRGFNLLSKHPVQSLQLPPSQSLQYLLRPHSHPHGHISLQRHPCYGRYLP